MMELGDFLFQVAQRFVGEAFGAGREIESFERDPALVSAAAQDFENRLEIVASGAAVAAVELVDVDVADQVEIAVHQLGVRSAFQSTALCTSNMVRTAGLPIAADDGDGFFQSLHHIALIDGQRFHQHRDAARGGVRRHRGESVDVVARGFFASQAAGGAALFGRSEDHDAVGSEVGAKIDEVADVVPTALAQGRVRSGDVQSLGADHQPVQADKSEAFVGDDAAEFGALGGA